MATCVVERDNATDMQETDDEMTFSFFISRMLVMETFPKSFAAMKQVMQAFYESGGLLCVLVYVYIHVYIYIHNYIYIYI